MLRRSWRSVLAISTAFVSQTALAQTSAETERGNAGEIVVTSLRKANASITGSDTPLLLYPQSVRVIDARAIEQLGATRLGDVVDLAGGVARQNDFGGLWDKYSIRGFAGDENSGPDILINRFGSNLGFNAPIDTATVERFEFLKGSAAALSGRGEPGGSLNIVTKTPTDDLQAQGSISYGSWNALRATGDLSAPIADGLSARIIGVVESKDSFRDYVHTNRELIAPSLSFTPSERIRFLYQAEYMRNRAPIDRGVVALGGDARAMDRRTFLGEPGDGRIDQKIFWQQGSVFASISDEVSIEGGLSYRNGSLVGYSTQADFGARGILPDGRTIGRTRRYHNFQWDDLSARIEATAKAETVNGGAKVGHGAA